MAQNSASGVEVPLVAARSWSERLTDGLQSVVSRILAPGPVGTPLRNALDGTWYGHPVHPMVNDVPTGAWTVTLVADALGVLPGRGRLAAAADAALVVGLAGAVGAAASGVADWSYTHGALRRTGALHWLGNAAAVGLYTYSLAQRLRGRRGAGRASAALGYGLMTWASTLGAELAYDRGIGVSHNAFEEGPEDFVTIARDSDIPEGTHHRFSANGAPVLVVRQGGQLFAMGDTCPHLGCSLSGGLIAGNTLTCQCHGSQFDVRTGKALRGPTAYAAPRYDVREVDGQVQVKRSASD